MWAPNRYSDDHEQGEQDLVAKIRDLEHVPEARQQPKAPLRTVRPEAGQRLVNWLPLAGGRPCPNGIGKVSTVPPAAVMAASAALENPWAFTVTAAADLAPAEHLDERALVGQAAAVERPRAMTSVRPVSSMHVEVDALVLDPERVVEALQLRHPLLQRHLAALEAAARPCCGPSGPWCLGRRSCRPCRRCPGRPASARGASPGAGFSSSTLMTHFSVTASGTASTVTRWGTRAIIPLISGRSGRVFVWPMPRRPRAAERAAVLRLLGRCPT